MGEKETDEGKEETPVSHSEGSLSESWGMTCYHDVMMSFYDQNKHTSD